MPQSQPVGTPAPPFAADWNVRSVDVVVEVFDPVGGSVGGVVDPVGGRSGRNGELATGQVGSATDERTVAIDREVRYR